jgi:superfamily II DNA or RNA helicase
MLLEITIASDLSFQKYGLSQGIVRSISERFTYENPVYIKNKRLGKRNFGVPRFIELLSESPDSYHLPRGCIGQLSELLDISGTDKSTQNHVEYPAPSLTLRDYQQTALNAMLASNQGILVAPCGSGKTEIGCALILGRRQKSLVLVHTRDLMQQWVERISTRLNVEPGIIGSGKWNDTKPVTIGTVQSLQNGLDAAFLNQFGQVILDEAHHSPARTFSEIINHFPAKYRHGLSATPNRADKLDFLMYAAFGRTLHEIKDADMDEGQTITPSIRVLETGSYFPQIDSYDQMLSCLFMDETRNSLIVENISKDARNGHSCLGLSQRISHLQTLSKMLSERFPGVKAAIITGKESPSFRNQALDRMRSGELQVLFSCKLADEGLDIPRLDRLFLCAPIRSSSRLIQQIGRIKRPFPGKQGAVVYDFLDDCISLAKSQFYTRSGVYKSQNIPIEKAISYGYRDFRKAA